MGFLHARALMADPGEARPCGFGASAGSIHPM